MLLVAAQYTSQSPAAVNRKPMHDLGKDGFKSAMKNAIGIKFKAGEGVDANRVLLCNQ